MGRIAVCDRRILLRPPDFCDFADLKPSCAAVAPSGNTFNPTLYMYLAWETSSSTAYLVGTRVLAFYRIKIELDWQFAADISSENSLLA